MRLILLFLLVLTGCATAPPIDPTPFEAKIIVTHGQQQGVLVTVEKKDGERLNAYVPHDKPVPLVGEKWTVKFDPKKGIGCQPYCWTFQERVK